MIFSVKGAQIAALCWKLLLIYLTLCITFAQNAGNNMLIFIALVGIVCE